MDKNMYSEKFLKFIEMWVKDFGISHTIDEKVCVDRDNNPIPWYTYPAIEYLSQSLGTLSTVPLSYFTIRRISPFVVLLFITVQYL